MEHSLPDRMRAIVTRRYGPPERMRIGEVARPRVRRGAALVRVRGATVTAGDCEMRAFEIPLMFWLPARLALGITGPRSGIIGQEFAGDVVAVGPGVTRVKVGDAVFGPTGPGGGAYGEFVAAPAKRLAKMPRGWSYADAATLPVGGLNALHFLRKAKLAAGESMLIHGAAGAIGTAALMIGKARGAVVTGVDRGDKLDVLRELGADHVVDCTREDYAADGATFDVVFDVAGKITLSDALRVLRPRGRLVIANPRFWKLMRGLLASSTSSRKVMSGIAGESAADLDELARLATDGALRPVVRRRFDIRDIVAAHRFVESGNKVGNVAIDGWGEAK